MIARMKAKLNFFVLSILLFAIAAYFASSLTFLLSDTGLRFIQIKALIANNWQSFAIEYPGLQFDPELRHTPFNYAYSLLDGELYFKITPFLPLIASWFYAAVGPIGLIIIPVVGTLVTAVSVFKLAQLTNLPHSKWLLWVTAIATPMFFYTFELWDHTIAVACASLSIYGVSYAHVKNKKLPAMLGGIALAIGLVQRQEMYIFAIAIGLATLINFWPQWPLLFSLIGGAFLGVVPLWILQYQWFGHPLGMALASNLLGYARPPYYSFNPEAIPYSRAATLGRFLFFIESKAFLPFCATLLVLLGIITIIFCLRVDKWRNPKILYLGFVFSFIGYGIYIYLASQAAILSGFVTTLPIIVLSLAFVDRSIDENPYRNIYQFNLLIALFYFLGMAISTPVDGGLQWGSRYLLPMLPSLIYAAAYTYHAYNQSLHGKIKSALNQVTLGLIGLSFLVQMTGLYVQVDQHNQAKTLHNTITALPTEVILTNAPFMPTHIASVENKTFLYVEEEDDVAKLIQRLDQANISQVAVIQLDAIPLGIPSNVGGLTVTQVDDFVYEWE